MLELICWGKNNSTLIWFIVFILIGLMLTSIGANEYVIGGIQIAYLVIHLYIFKYAFNSKCKELEDKNEFEKNKKKKVRFDHMSK